MSDETEDAVIDIGIGVSAETSESISDVADTEDHTGDAEATTDADPEPQSDDGDAGEGSESDSQEVDVKPKKGRLQKRFDKITGEKERYKAKAELLQEMIDKGQINVPQSVQDSNTDGPPYREQFDSDEDYEQAAVDYSIDQRVNAAVDAKLKGRETESVQALWAGKKAEAIKALPDYEEVIEESDAPLSPVMEEAIVTSDIGPNIAYYLAKHPEQATQIHRMKPIAAAKAIGKIEAVLSTRGGKRVSKAPAPAKPIGGSGGGAKKNPENMSQAEYEAWRLQQIKKKRGG